MEGLKSAQRYLDEISAVIKQSFGPNGKDVLLKSGTGVIYLTKNGTSILQHLQVTHPIATFVKNSVLTYVSSAGDNSKTFLLTMRCFLDLLVKKYIDDSLPNRLERTRSVLSFMSTSLEKLSIILSADMLASHCGELGCLLSKPCGSFFTELFDGVFTVLVSGKFSLDVSSRLRNIIIDVFSAVSFTPENVAWMIANYNSISIHVNGVPFHQSRFLSGSIVQREPVPRDATHEECKFLLMSGTVTQSVVDNLEISLSTDSDVSKHRTTSKEFYKKVVSVLLKQGVTVLFVENQLPLLFRSALQSAGLTYVPFVEEDDMCWLSGRYNISLISGIYDLLHVENFAPIIGCATFFKSCTLGLHVCSYIGPQTQPPVAAEKAGQLNFQIIVSAIYEGLTVQYSECIMNCLRVLNKCFHHTTPETTVRLIPSCGFFEGSLMRKVLESTILSTTPAATGFDTEFVHCDNGNKRVCGCSDTERFPSASSLRLSCEELEVFKLLVEALQVVCKCLHMNSNAPNRTLSHEVSGLDDVRSPDYGINSVNEHNKYDNEITGNRKYVQSRRGVCIDPVSGKNVDAQVVKHYEPLHSKVDLLRSLLECCAQVVRIDNIVPVAKVKLDNPDDEVHVNARV